MSDLSISAQWREPKQAEAHFKAVVLPFCREQWQQGQALQIEVRLHEDAKTDKQRGYYHGVILLQIAQQAKPGGVAHGLSVWKEYFRSEFLGFKTVTALNPMTGKKSRKRVRISTEDLGVRAYAKLIDRVTAFAVTELGVRFTMDFATWSSSIDPNTGEVLF